MRIKPLFNLVVISSALLLSACNPPNSRGPGGPGGAEGGPDRKPPPFTELDPNGDGNLTLDEFSQHPIPQGQHADIFRMIDTNGDGIITQTEYDSHEPPPPPKR